MKNFTKSSTILVIILGLLLASCGKDSVLKNEVYNNANLAEIVEKVKADKNFKKEDIEMFSAGIARFAATPDTINGKTIAQIIDQQKDYMRESSVAGLLNTALTTSHGFKYLGWQSQELDGKQYNLFGFILQNRTKQDMKRMLGLMKFVDQNNVMIRGFRINIAQIVKSGMAAQFNSTFPVEPNNASDEKLIELLKAKAPNVYVVWQPELVEFANGKKLAINDNIQ